MQVTEIFKSIQGESTLQGLPCVFIRLTGCNLDCAWCDTRYARTGGSELWIDDIIGEVERYGVEYICITGGEPLLQQDTPLLIGACLARGWRVSIETNGSINPAVIPKGAVRVIDVKCPGSGEAGATAPEVFSERRATDEYKFVVGDRTDFEFALATIRNHKLSETGTVLISPLSGKLSPSTAAGWLCEELPDARLNLQLHTFIWPGLVHGR